jgi:hypothetical protein
MRPILARRRANRVECIALYEKRNCDEIASEPIVAIAQAVTSVPVAAPQ